MKWKCQRQTSNTVLTLNTNAFDNKQTLAAFFELQNKTIFPSYFSTNWPVFHKGNKLLFTEQCLTSPTQTMHCAQGSISPLGSTERTHLINFKNIDFPYARFCSSNMSIVYHYEKKTFLENDAGIIIKCYLNDTTASQLQSRLCQHDQ